MAKHKKSRKQIKAIKAKAKKPKNFDIWKHQVWAERKLKKVQRKNPEGHVWEDFYGAESKPHTEKEGLS